MINKNKGTLIECIINRSIAWFLTEERALFFQKTTMAVFQNNQWCFLKKSTTDYYGLYRQKYIEIEAKQTKQLTFKFNAIQAHQWKQLSLVRQHGGYAFLIIQFTNVDKIFMIESLCLSELFQKNNQKPIHWEQFVKYGYQLELQYPVVIDFLNYIDQFLNIS